MIQCDHNALTIALKLTIGTPGDRLRSMIQYYHNALTIALQKAAIKEHVVEIIIKA